MKYSWSTRVGAQSSFIRRVTRVTEGLVVGSKQEFTE